MANTQHRNWPLPDPAKTVREEFEQLLAVTFPMMDADMKDALAGLAEKASRDHTHTIQDVDGLENALSGKLPGNTVFRLTMLEDVEGVNEAPDGYILAKQGNKVLMLAASAVLGSHQHQIAGIIGLEDALEAISQALGQKIDKSSVWHGTQAAYDAIATKDPNVTYNIYA